MKKVISMVLAFSMTAMLVIGLTGCAEEGVTLETQTVNGISISVPSDFGQFEDDDDIMIAADKNSYATIGITPAGNSQGTSVADWTKEIYQENVLIGLVDVKIVEFDNTTKIGENPTLLVHYTAKNENEISIDGYNYLIYLPDGKFQSVSLTFDMDNENSLENNLEDIKSSISVK